MNIVVKVRHMKITEAIREYAQTKAARLPRFFNQIQSIEVILDMEANRPVVETVVTARGRNTFVATHHNGDMYACIDLCLDKMAGQLRRHKDKVRAHTGPAKGETSGPSTS